MFGGLIAGRGLIGRLLLHNAVVYDNVIAGLHVDGLACLGECKLAAGIAKTVHGGIVVNRALESLSVADYLVFGNGDAGKKVSYSAIKRYPFSRAMDSPLSTE